MPRIIRSPQSGSDVYEIARYIAEDSTSAAFRLIDTIDEKLAMLADAPRLGRARHNLGPQLRSYPIGNYLHFYRPVDDGIEIVRVIHGARNLRRLFKRTP